MKPGILVGYFIVPVLGAMLCAMAGTTRPTVPFGVRVPADHAGTTVIRRERNAYVRRTAVVTACATAAVFGSWGHGSWWLARIILAAELAAELGCFWWAHRQIALAKQAGGWFAGQRTAVAADTRWRTEPEPFPVLWLVPAVAVIAVTFWVRSVFGPAATHLPAHGFAPVIGQAYVTTLWTAMALLDYSSRPDLDPADPDGSLDRYRKMLGALARALLILAAGVDGTLLLYGCRIWHVVTLPGLVVLLPFAAGVLTMIATIVRAGRQRAAAERAGLGRARVAGVTAWDDDRWWKAGLFYVNRDDPSLLVPARFAAGWTFNFGNPSAWLVLTGIVAAPAGLALLLR